MNLKIFISALLILLVAQKLSTQEPSIIFNDYVPDVTLFYPQKDTLKIDMDSDSADDIMFFLYGASSGNYAYIKPINTKWGITTFSNRNTDTLRSDQIIWISNQMVFLGRDNTEKLAVKLTINDLNYYGWISVYFTIKNMNRAVHIDKYAFCTIPDYPLVWGQTELTGAKEIKVQDEVKVSVDGQSKSITIQSKEVIKDISLINSAGRVIQKWRNLKSSMMDIPSGGIKGGIYVIRVKNMNNEVFTEKVVL
jgi:hypothetical protein